MIYHITTRDEWQAAQAAGEYRAESLDTQGFIHASTREQVVETANLVFRGQDGLVLLCIDESRLSEPVRYQAPDGPRHREDAGLFPHIYGPLNLEAVTEVLDFPVRGDGSFALPFELQRRLQREPAGLRQVTVHATNYDGSFHWGHPAWLLRADDGIVMTRTEPGLTVKTETGHYVSPYDTRAHYWRDRWFNVIRLEEPGKGLFGYYCNIATPPEFDGDTLHYVDLQLDVRVFADRAGGLTHRLMDEEEFEAARERYGYAGELVQRCWQAVEDLVAMIDSRRFPFDG